LEELVIHAKVSHHFGHIFNLGEACLIKLTHGLVAILVLETRKDGFSERMNRGKYFVCKFMKQSSSTRLPDHLQFEQFN
jgi:predicted phage tail protein